MIKVSVIVPVYNAEKYLEQCLESVVNQTLKNIEIIVINDGSTDDSEKIIDEYKKKYSNMIRSYQQRNQGLYRTRQIGLSYALGEYVGWVDADDFVKWNMFEKLYETAKENNSDVVYCDYAFYPEKLKTKEKWFRPYLGEKNVTYVERNSQPWNKIVRRELLEKLKIGEMFPECFDESYIKVLLKAKNPVSIEEELYIYRVGGNTMSSSYQNISHYLRFFEASTALKNQMWDDIQKDSYWKEYFEFREIYYLLLSMLIAANAKDRKMFRKIKSQLQQLPRPYRKNMHLKNILNENYGKLKGFAIGNLIPLNYRFTRLMCQLAF